MFREARHWFTGKVIFGAIIFAVVLFGVLLAILWSARPETYSQPATTAILSVITAPTETPLFVATKTPTPAPTSVEEQTPPPGGNFKIGDYVQVSGTGGDGLRLHGTAGVASEVRYVAIDAEVFIVMDGPTESDGYTWWLLQDPYNNTVVGWGASNYLSPVQTPE